MSQNAKILKHLKERGSITSMEAFREYGITRLSGRCLELRKTHNIETVIVKSSNPGSAGDYARYFYKGQKIEVIL